MLTLQNLPHVLAALNAATVVALMYGRSRILVGDRQRHRAAMLVASGLGVAFLIVYLYYHAHSGLAKFGGEGAIRPIYFTLLAIHVLAAALSAVLVPIAVVNALRGRFAMHKRFARWAWPIWMFVSVSGLVVYVMAVHLYPYSAAGPSA